MKKKEDKRIRLKKKIRFKVNGTSARPRLSVFRSNKFIYAQVINDETGRTLAEASDIPKKSKNAGKTSAKASKTTKTERAKEVGKAIAVAALKAKIDKVVFDRNGFKYTGRIKLVADEARANGLKF